MTPVACRGALIADAVRTEADDHSHLQIVSDAADALATDGYLFDRLQVLLDHINAWLPAGVAWLFVQVPGQSLMRVVAASGRDVPTEVSQWQVPGCAELVDPAVSCEPFTGLCSDFCRTLCGGQPAACNMNLPLRTGTGVFGALNVAGWTGPEPDESALATLNVLAHLAAQAIEAADARQELGTDRNWQMAWKWVERAGSTREARTRMSYLQRALQRESLASGPAAMVPSPASVVPEALVTQHWRAIGDEVVQIQVPEHWRIVARQTVVHGRPLRLVAHAPEGADTGGLALYTLATQGRSLAEIAEAERAHWQDVLAVEGHDLDFLGPVIDRSGRPCGFTLRRQRHGRMHYDTTFCVADGQATHVVRVHLAADRWDFAADLEIVRSLAVLGQTRPAPV